MRILAVTPLLFLCVGALSGQTTVVVTQLYQPITGQQRFAWFTNAALGPSSLLAGGVSAGIDTLRNEPVEYGSHWGGFGERYGFRVANRTISSGIEAGLGSLWGEDPRYHRVPERSFGARLRNVVRMTVIAHDRNGREMPAYARLIAVPSTSFLSNAWVPDSRNSPGDAMNRIGVSFATHMLSNAIAEFWPDLRRRLHRQGPAEPALTPAPVAFR